MEAPDPLFAFHAIREGLQRFLRNDVEYALDLFAEKRKSSILHAVGACMLYTFEGLITYDKGERSAAPSSWGSWFHTPWLLPSPQ